LESIFIRKAIQGNNRSRINNPINEIIISINLVIIVTLGFYPQGSRSTHKHLDFPDTR
jgi:hypothetical protein